MPFLSILLNVLWILTGGTWMALAWLVAGVIMAITIVGIPWTRAAFNIAGYTLLPFGRTAVSREEVQGHEDLGTGPLGALGNLVWLLLAGWWLALGHILVALALAITLIGIPFAWAHLKLVPISLWPIGKVVLDRDEAAQAAGPAGRRGGIERAGPSGIWLTPRAAGVRPERSAC